MSVGVQTWVFQQSESTGNDRLVLLAIADEADDDGTNAYPSIETIARKARVNRATALRAIRRLEEQAELVVRRPEKHGRGRYNVYVVLMGRDLETVADCDLSGKGAKTSRKGAEGRAQTRPDPKTQEPKDPETNPLVVASDDATQRVVAELCSLLADAVANHGAANAVPRVTNTWRKDMSLLLRRGPTDTEPAPIAPERVARCVSYVFTQLAEPEGADGFCWADQVQSPAALRRHWTKLANAARSKQKGGTPQHKRQRMLDDMRAEADIVDIGSRTQ